MARTVKVSENTGISMPLKNLISIVAAVAIGVWAYFGIIERLNIIETNGKLMQSDLEKNTESLELSGHEVRWALYLLIVSSFY